MNTVFPEAEPELSALSPVGPRRSAADIAYARLREALISLALPPGSVVSRLAIAQRLGISQTPVREALIRLQDEHLIEVVPQSATRVSRIDLNHAREAHFLRLALEVEVVRRLARAPAPELGEALREELRRMRAVLADSDRATFAEADEAFHLALFSAARVPRLRELVRSRGGHLDRLRRLHLPEPGKTEAVLQQHEALAAAILAADVAGAEAALRAHLSGTFAEAERLRAANPAFFA
ncbi:GntR family transcriptional regulator [Falsiroseomonas tokyonensis]|uniref:GntR family transcriptional regulator n=1 Tax=Falsiroseomonas tokyonensis TaxID=430521 RepID=A0ABV7BW02_9PROT|nr:GntR family transcriptional regulator [Falsiroseomonas tokyonensis]MBU8539157.1 GntR family transcriptional regulator [Falsiroseomonas tokyonensis]